MDQITAHFLSRLPTCAQSSYVKTRQNALNSLVRRFAAGVSDRDYTLHDCCRTVIDEQDDRLILGAIACLFVIGDGEDLIRLNQLDGHPDSEVRKAAGVCRFEIKKRGRM